MSIFQKIRIAGAILLWLPASGFTQVVPGGGQAGVDSRQAGKRTALDAFKRGDGIAGLEVIKNNTDRGHSARSVDVQVVNQLREITIWMVNERHPRTLETALLAVGEAEKTKGKLSPADEAEVAAVTGSICEQATGDVAAAKRNYEAALRSNPKQEDALKGLARIQAYERVTAAKARENEALRVRKLQPPRP